MDRRLASEWRDWSEALVPLDPSANSGANHSGGRVGDFELIRIIGRGGMGEVWEARQLTMDRRVALKLLPTTLSQDPKAVLRFHREAQAGALLTHRNIAAVYSAGMADGRLFIAQEFVPGKSLAEWIQSIPRDGRLPKKHFTEVARIVHRIALALEYAHGEGIVHRDVKPQNILLTLGPEPKLVDFGLAQIDDDFVLSESGEIAGTYAYMSPEQARARSAEVDHRTDVFSLGATLYELLTLDRPFQGDSVYEIADKILHEAPRHPRERRPEVPEALAEACLAALEKEKNDRYPTMLSFAARISGDSMPTSKPSDIDLGLLQKTAIALACAVALLGAAWLFKRGSSDVAVKDVSISQGATAEKALSLGKVLVASPGTIVDGIARLREAHALDPTPPEFEELLSTIREALDHHAQAGRPVSAALLAQELRILSDSAEDLKRVRLAEAAARDLASRTVSVLSPLPGSIVASASVSLNGTVTDPLFSGAIEVMGEPVEIVEARFQCQTTLAADGEQEVELKVRFPDGLDVTLPLQLFVDTLPPALTVRDPGHQGMVRPRFVVEGSVEDKTATTITAADQSRVMSTSGTWSMEVTLPSGPQALRVRAADSAGHSIEHEIRLVVDDEPPKIAGLENNSEVVSRYDSAALAVHISDDLSLGTVAWDGAPLVVDSGGWVQVRTHPPVDEGEATIHRLTAADLAGNETMVQVHARWDRTPPEVRLSALEATAIRGDGFVLEGSFLDRSACRLVCTGIDVPLEPGQPFRTLVPIAPDSPDRMSLCPVIRDAAGNETPSFVALTVVSPCRSCTLVDGKRGACLWCSGTGVASVPCHRARCVKGRIEEPCQTCKQTGLNPCRVCSASGVKGRAKCSECAEGSITCDSCDGRKRLTRTCRNCDGKGWVKGQFISRLDCSKCTAGIDSFDCPSCEGMGFQACAKCDAGFIVERCVLCKNGMGPSSCRECQGATYIVSDCYACDNGLVTETCHACRGSRLCKDCHGTGQKTPVK